MRQSARPVLTLPLKYLVATFLFVTVLSINTDIAVAPTAYAQTLLIPPPVTFHTINIPEKVDPLASNCWAYVKSIYPDLPLTQDIYTNTSPHVGAVAFFKYGELNHYGIITKLQADGFWIKDTNFGGPGYRTHFISWDNPHIRGFYQPGTDTS